MDAGGRTWRSVSLLVMVWLVLQVGGMFSPGLLDDVDSVYTEIAREMLHRHDFVTPYVDGVRFFDKPPLMYWLAAGSMKVFGEHDWAARLPIVLTMLGLTLAVYGLGRRLYGERGGFYAALALGTAVGPYLYTRFFIPDVPLCLWMTLDVWLFLVWLDEGSIVAEPYQRRSTWAAAGFGAVLGLNLLTKGLIGFVFPVGFCLVYLLVTRQGRRLGRARTGVAALALGLVALPWHVLAWMRNPAVAMPAGLGLPARAGWGWFYLYNEHVARFLGRRIPHDYGNTPVWLFWLYAVLWVMPWAVFLPAALRLGWRRLGPLRAATVEEQEAALTVAIWAGIVMLFFSVSNRQEYYSLPALPALALLVGAVLAAAESQAGRSAGRRGDGRDTAWIAVERCHGWALVPLTLAVAGLCGWFSVTAPRPRAGMDLSALLASNPAMYNLSLGHIFDLTGRAMGLFRGPLAAVAAGMLIVGPISFLLRLRGRAYAANVVLAGGMLVVLLAAHEGLVRFYPIMGSKGLAEAIVAAQEASPRTGDLIVLDGEMTSGSTLLFYTRQPVHLVNGRVNGPWFGSLWLDAPPIFEDEASLRRRWAGPSRVFLMTYRATAREGELGGRVLAESGGKTVLVNR